MKFDVAIVGSGLAGLSVALHLAETRKVAIVSKRALLDGASNWAQGGIAAVLDSGDSHEQHIADTLEAGGGLCDEGATRYIVEHGREAIEWLIAQGVPFTRDESAELGFHLTREGGHSQRRIIHAADATGHAVQVTLEEKVRAHPNITLFEHHCAIDLITTDKLGPRPVTTGSQTKCHGLYMQDTRDGQVHTVAAEHTVMATGGAGKVYLYTTNPDTASGDGIAMAWRAGCRVSNMEFIQFHPTCLYHPYAKSFLITEAIRGEGGLLKLPPEAGAAAGQRFMLQHDPRAELAPRDVVARAIDFEIKKRGLDYVHLDISHKPADFLIEHFPTIYARCLELGIDITKEPIPIVPAAHYTCGGVVTDLFGRTDLPGLYAVGETACTGLHGANRLASNSLLECVVIGRACAQDILSQEKEGTPYLPDWDESRVTDADEEVVIAHNWDELRRSMWNYVGIVRTTKRLERAQHRIALLKEEIDEYYGKFRITADLLELRNLVDVASMIVNSALQRRESRGLHYSRDYPGTLPKALPSILTPFPAMTPQAVAQAQLDAYNAHDVEALCALYADDACQYRHPDILLAQGRQAIRRRYAERFAGSSPRAQLLQRIVSGNTVVDSERVHDGASYTELLAIYEVMNGRIAKAWFRNGATTQLRVARHDDIPVMEALIARSGIELSKGFYSEEQAAAVTRHVFGVDTQLVEDETYFIIERDGEALACGGWSKRATLFGGDQHKSGPDPLLDPATQPGRIRAFFVDPTAPRQGLGTLLMQHCEREAAAQGFQVLELAATMPGVPLYKAAGFESVEDFALTLPGDVSVPLARMRKRIA